MCGCGRIGRTSQLRVGISVSTSSPWTQSPASWSRCNASFGASRTDSRKVTSIRSSLSRARMGSFDESSRPRRTTSPRILSTRFDTSRYRSPCGTPRRSRHAVSIGPRTGPTAAKPLSYSRRNNCGHTSVTPSTRWSRAGSPMIEANWSWPAGPARPLQRCVSPRRRSGQAAWCCSRFRRSL